jgi:hypothetical protein
MGILCQSWNDGRNGNSTSFPPRQRANGEERFCVVHASVLARNLSQCRPCFIAQEIPPDSARGGEQQPPRRFAHPWYSVCHHRIQKVRRKVEQSKKTPLHLRQAQRQQQRQMQRRQNVNKRETDPSMRHCKHYFRRGQKGSAPASLHDTAYLKVNGENRPLHVLNAGH